MMMTTRQIISNGFWDSTPIGRSIDLCLCPNEFLSPQLILEDKILHSAICLRNNHSQIQFIGTLISDDESQRLTYVIDRLLTTDSTTYDINNHQSLTGEFLIPIQFDNNKNSTTIQNAMKEINVYCHSSLPIELHRFLYLCGQISSYNLSSIDLSFDLLTIKNNFLLTPINSNHIQIIPTALLKNLSSSKGTNTYMNRPNFGYFSLDRMSKDKILLILENDPQASTLPLIGIWISGIIDIQCPFVWTVCIHYCLNSSLKQRIRSGINCQQSFLLGWYSSTSYNQCNFYEVYSTSLLTIDYDLWKCSKEISIPNLSSYQYEINSNIQFPYDFQFKRVYNHSNNYFPSSPNTNGSLFGIPRIPPKQSTHQSPSWDSPAATIPITTTPKRILRSSITSPQSSTTIITNDNQWKEEFVERIKSYESQIQSLTTVVNQLLTIQQNSSLTPIKECTKRDIGIQSQSSSPCINDELKSINKMNQSNLRSPVVHQDEETMIDYSSIHGSSLISTDVNPVDILKPIFQFIDNQQQKQQQGSASSLMKTNNSMDTTLLKINNEEEPENMLHLGNIIQQQQKQQQHVTSTTTTGISFISNSVQMQFINQQSSTTTVYPQSQSISSPQRSENSLSIEVHGLEMKYLEDDQLAVAIECDRQSQTPQVVDKSLSFETQEYLQRYGLFTQSSPPQ